MCVVLRCMTSALSPELRLSTSRQLRLTFSSIQSTSSISSWRTIDMTSKTGMAQSLLRSYNSIVKRQTSQLQSSASRTLGLGPRLSFNDAVRSHFDRVAQSIQGYNGGLRLQAIPVQSSSLVQRRWRSTNSSPPKIYSYEDVRFPSPLIPLQTILSSTKYNNSPTSPGPINRLNPLRKPPPHRRPRTPRILRKHHPHRHKPAHNIPTRRLTPQRRRFRRPLRFRQTAAKQRGCLFL